MIIALTGEKLAGKGTLAAYLAKEYQAEIFGFSRALTDVLTRLHQVNSRDNLVKLGQAIRQVYGDDILAQVVKLDVEKSPAKLKVIDGMRYVAEYDLLKTLPDFHLVYVTAPIDLRYERMKQRTEKIDEATMSFTEFQHRETDSTEQGIQALAKFSEFTINNNRSMPDLYQALNNSALKF